MALFDGDTFSQQHDGARLGTLLEQVKKLMSDGNWRTMGEIQEILKRGSEASISARLRDLRKPKFGAHEVNRRRRGEPSDGLWEYQVFLNPSPPSTGSVRTASKTDWMKVASQLGDLVRQVGGTQAPQWVMGSDAALAELEELRGCERAKEDEDEDDYLDVLDD